MRSLSQSRFAVAVATIDGANAADPTAVMVRGSERPLALVHGELAAEWVVALLPDADELVSLAARAHHLRRWELPRSSYDAGKAGYLRWKRDQRQRHAHDVGELLAAVGYSAEEIEQVQAMVLRRGPGGQLVEDAACLVFIETQLAAVATQLDRDHLIDVIRKTAKKMSPEALAAVGRIPLGETEQSLLAAALA
ncbi:MAG: DUF4202 family protein [Actinobacteria bacterium]|uniref:Unannotated protein n=1 Tax=freshwater metagenome TaxID=449393 RepID=A0A6J7MEJ3_9ZZZZ|nr:DUF4202 family protein [Actinomycetota bacterium]MSW76278.1 DUF4202 family protein [Actinomycetota bacterium]MSX56263.1 DUF4202 family protein [Actinomycetota bacterium]MSX94488.1 DUF4202 family protein [Actinomycetota bacterium]MSZ81988.1 DUF4202 family protein [Actinomycetota bacterium]